MLMYTHAHTYTLSTYTFMCIYIDRYLDHDLYVTV